MKPRISIVIPVYNGEKTINFCLSSLMNLDFPKDEIELIVVDNNSTDSTKEIVNAYSLRYVFEAKRSRGAARNKGIKGSEAELIAFIDADCLADKLWLKNLLKGFTSKIIAGCGGEILSYPAETLIEKYYDLRNLVSQKKGFIDISRIAGSNAVFRRRALEEVGLFDESLITNEDIDLSWRLLSKGYQINYVPEAIVYHRHPTRLMAFLKGWVEYGLASSCLLKKYEGIRIGLYDNWREFFSYQWQSSKMFFRTLFLDGNMLNKVFIMLDLLRNIAYFWGRIYGLNKIRLKKEKFLIEIDHAPILRRIVNDEMIISDFRENFSYLLNETGTRILMLLIEGKDLSQIMDILTTQYYIEKDEIKDEVVTFIEEVKNKGWLLPYKSEDSYENCIIKRY